MRVLEYTVRYIDFTLGKPNEKTTPKTKKKKNTCVV